MISRTSFFLACFALSILAGLGFSRATPVLSAGSATVNVGDMVTIPISIAGETGLTSFQFDLAFTPSIVEVLSFDDTGTDFETAALSQGGNLTGITGFIDNATGLLSGVADSMSGISGSGLTGAGVLADITFEALSPGVSPLILSNAFLTDGGAPLSSANGDFLLQNGQIVVRGTAAVPEPGTLLLLVAALGAACLLRSLVSLMGQQEPLHHSVIEGEPAMNNSVRLVASMLLGISILAGGHANAQVFQNGPYYANPSWDQQLPASTRFVILSNWSNNAVLDRETGLVWEKVPTSNVSPWVFYLSACFLRSTGGRLGWRMPSIEEFLTLMDPATFKLVAGAPFDLSNPNGNFHDAIFWTTTTDASTPANAFQADFTGSGAPFESQPKSNDQRLWCVRGGQGTQSPQ
jgi:Protein of unknown function (DUF1566)/Cohesin domain